MTDQDKIVDSPYIARAASTPKNVAISKYIRNTYPMDAVFSVLAVIFLIPFVLLPGGIFFSKGVYLISGISFLACLSIKVVIYYNARRKMTPSDISTVNADIERIGNTNKELLYGKEVTFKNLRPIFIFVGWAALAMIVVSLLGQVLTHF